MIFFVINAALLSNSREFSSSQTCSVKRSYLFLILKEAISSYRLDFEPNQVEELIEIARMLDILGAEVQYSEYGIVGMLNHLDIEEWSQFSERIPVAMETFRVFDVEHGIHQD
jgi:hypothetical protein